MSSDHAPRHDDGTGPPPGRRPSYRWAGTRPTGSRPGRPRPTNSRPATTHRPVR